MIDVGSRDFGPKFFQRNFLLTIYAACIKLKHLVSERLIRTVEKLLAQLDIKKS